MINTSISLNDNIAFLRRSKHWNRTILSAKTGIKKDRIEGYEKGLLKLRLLDTYKLSRVFEVTMDELVFGVYK